jgi:hypothetical protein
MIQFNCPSCKTTTRVGDNAAGKKGKCPVCGNVVSIPPASTDDDAAEWYYQVMGEETGPVSAAQLKQLAQRGEIRRDTYVRKGADGNWTTADHIRGLFNEPAPHASDTTKPSTDAAMPQHRKRAVATKAARAYEVTSEPTKHRYPFLLLLAAVYRILAGVVIGLGVVAVIVIMVVRGPSGFPTAIITMAVCVAAGLPMLICAEVIRVFLDMEQNTRQTNDLLRAVIVGLDQLSDEE